MTNMSKEPDTGSMAAEDQGGAQLDALLVAADEQMLAAIKRRLNLDTGLADILGSRSGNEPSAQRPAGSNLPGSAVASARETAHVGLSPFSASSWRRLWKRLRQKQQQPAPAHQAAALIEMRLITRTLAGYFTNLTDRADDVAVDMKRANQECQDMATPVLAGDNWRPRTDALRNTEKALQQVVVDAGGLALDLEGPCELASKLADTARVAGDRSLVRAGTELAAALTKCRESAKGTWSAVSKAREVAAWLATLTGEGRLLAQSDTHRYVARIRDLTFQAMGQQAGLTGALQTATDRNPARYLESIEIDASGADLSDANVPDVDILDLVIWTHETTWPVAMEDQVRNYSREIREDVYQVHSGGRTKYKSVDV